MYACVCLVCSVYMYMRVLVRASHLLFFKNLFPRSTTHFSLRNTHYKLHYTITPPHYTLHTTYYIPTNPGDDGSVSFSLSGSKRSQRGGGRSNEKQLQDNRCVVCGVVCSVYCFVWCSMYRVYVIPSPHTHILTHRANAIALLKHRRSGQSKRKLEEAFLSNANTQSRGTKPSALQHRALSNSSHNNNNAKTAMQTRVNANRGSATQTTRPLSAFGSATLGKSMKSRSLSSSSSSSSGMRVVVYVRHRHVCAYIYIRCSCTHTHVCVHIECTHAQASIGTQWTKRNWSECFMRNLDHTTWWSKKRRIRDAVRGCSAVRVYVCLCLSAVPVSWLNLMVSLLPHTTHLYNTHLLSLSLTHTHTHTHTGVLDDMQKRESMEESVRSTTEEQVTAFTCKICKYTLQYIPCTCIIVYSVFVHVCVSMYGQCS
jgi:hypothetical protein